MTTEERKIKNQKAKARNKERKKFRREHPEHQGKKLKKVPLEKNL